MIELVLASDELTVITLDKRFKVQVALSRLGGIKLGDFSYSMRVSKMKADQAQCSMLIIQ